MSERALGSVSHGEELVAFVVKRVGADGKVTFHVRGDDEVKDTLLTMFTRTPAPSVATPDARVDEAHIDTLESGMKGIGEYMTPFLNDKDDDDEPDPRILQCPACNGRKSHAHCVGDLLATPDARRVVDLTSAFLPDAKWAQHKAERRVIEAAREWVRVRRDPSSYSIAVSVAQDLELAVRALAATTPREG